MPAFAIWGRFTQIGPHEFLITVSAVPLKDDEHAPALERDVVLRTNVCGSLREAQERRDAMVLALAQDLRSAGHLVQDTEVE